MSEDLVGIGKAAVRLIESGEKFLERLVGPWLDEKGQSLADGLRLKRMRNLATVAGISKHHIGRHPVVQVPGRVLFPLLEAASNEDEPLLQKKWAALLANAATATLADSRIPACLDILQQLTPIHARLLEWLYRNSRQRARGKRNPKAPGARYQFFLNVSRDVVLRAFPMTLSEYNQLALDLYRHQLIDGGQLESGTLVEGGPILSPTFAQIRLTQRAHEFIEAVNPPGADLGGITLPPSRPEEPAAKRRAAKGYRSRRRATKVGLRR